jgi:glycosyltransferase involved in cell wall biosynthesis
LKVLHILQNYEPSKGGTQFLFKSISDLFVSYYKDDVEVVTTNSLFDPSSDKFSLLPSNELINGVHVRRFSFISFHRMVIKFLNKIFFKFFGFKLGLIDSLLSVPISFKMRSYIYNSNVDVICASSSYYKYMDYASKRLLQSNSKPFVFMGAIHFDNEKCIEIPKRVIENINNSDKYIANTEFEKNNLIKLGINPDKINVIGCGVNPTDYIGFDKVKSRKELGLPDDVFIIGYVGRFAPKKGITTLLHSFHEFNVTNSILVLAGAKNSYYYDIVELINTRYLSLKPRIFLIADFEEELKPLIYNSLDIFVCPSFSESFGIVFLEAWASGLPVVGTSIGAIRSLIEDGNDGKLFPPHDFLELKLIIEFYYQNPDLRTLHAKNGLLKINQRFTWEKVTEAYRKTYLEAIQIHKNSICVAS